jgi:hypothetical protein
MPHARSYLHDPDCVAFKGHREREDQILPAENNCEKKDREEGPVFETVPLGREYIADVANSGDHLLDPPIANIAPLQPLCLSVRCTRALRQWFKTLAKADVLYL